MPQLVMYKGLSGSGKSTEAKTVCELPNWKRVNKDLIRLMLDNSKWSRDNEKFVLVVRDTLIGMMMEQGFNIIVDDTNFAPFHESQLREMVNTFNKSVGTAQKYVFSVKFFDVTLETALIRNAGRPEHERVPEKVIRKQYSDYLAQRYVPYIRDPELPDAIIVDLDGTLAHKTGTRDYYDYSRVSEDTVDEVIRDICWAEVNKGTEVIICSGRDESCRTTTAQWLYDNTVPHNMLLFRADGDKRPDPIVKQEIYEAHVKGKYNVKFVLDDRRRVVDMWRRQGLKTLQVAEGEF